MKVNLNEYKGGMRLIGTLVSHHQNGKQHIEVTSRDGWGKEHVYTLPGKHQISRNGEIGRPEIKNGKVFLNGKEIPFDSQVVVHVNGMDLHMPHTKAR